MGRAMTLKTLQGETSRLLIYLEECQEVTTSESAQEEWVMPRLVIVKHRLTRLLRSAKHHKHSESYMCFQEAMVIVDRFILFNYAMQGFSVFWHLVNKTAIEIDYHLDAAQKV